MIRKLYAGACFTWSGLDSEEQRQVLLLATYLLSIVVASVLGRARQRRHAQIHEAVMEVLRAAAAERDSEGR